MQRKGIDVIMQIMPGQHGSAAVLPPYGADPAPKTPHKKGACDEKSIYMLYF